MMNVAAFNNPRLLQLISMFQLQMMSVSVRRKLLYEGILLMLGMCEILNGFSKLTAIIKFVLDRCKTWSVALRDS
jgi:hypothetical protein